MNIKTFRVLIFTASFFIINLNATASIKKAQKVYHSKKRSKISKNRIITYQLVKAKYYFSAIPFAKNYIRQTNKISKKFEAVLKTLLIKTGSDTYLGMNKNILKKHIKRSPTLALILGLRLFKERRYSESYNVLKKIPYKHQFAPEALMTRGTIKSLQGDLDKAIKIYRGCKKAASDLTDNDEHEKQERYYNIINETCQIHIARIKFKQKKYEESIDEYEKIKKTSYRWPYILLEKAWANFYLKNYNRTLGLLVTYRSPLLASYFLPETEPLTALTYKELCLWDDSSHVIKQYYTVYKKKSAHLLNILTKHKQSHSYFRKLVLAPLDQFKKKNRFMKNLIIQIRKQIKFSLDYTTLQKVTNEYSYLDKFKRTSFIGILLKSVKEFKRLEERQLNYFVKKQMFHFINEINKYSYDMFDLKLELMSLKRTLIYQNKKLISNRNRGDYSFVKRRPNQEFWDFRGAFWADELGDYSFGLKSNCEIIKQQIENKSGDNDE